MPARKKIGVKYCGGCNPTYERVNMLRQVQSLFTGKLLFLRYDEPDIEVILLLSGCHRTCAGQDFNPTEISCYSVTGENDFKNLIDYLISVYKTNGVGATKP